MEHAGNPVHHQVDSDLWREEGWTTLPNGERLQVFAMELKRTK
jgi:hypothetical protein